MKAAAVAVSPAPQEGGPITLASSLVGLVDTWFEERKSGVIGKALRPQSATFYENVLVDLRPRITGLTLQTATTAALEVVVQELARVKPGYAYTARSILKMSFDRVLRLSEVLTVNPVLGTTPVSREKKVVQALTGAEVTAFRKLIHEKTDGDDPLVYSRLAAVVSVMLGTGSRIGEVLGLRWQHVHLDAAEPYIEITATAALDDRTAYIQEVPKTDASHRTVLLPTFAVKALERAREVGLPSDLNLWWYHTARHHTH